MARGILKRILGQNSKLLDDDDFYALGGDSLAVVEAVCELRRADFPASVHLFATTGRIGDLLSDLEHKLCVINEDHFSLDKSKPTNHRRVSTKNKGESLIPGLQFHLVVSDWIVEPGNTDSLGMEQVVTYVVDCFLKRDKITKAFNLTKRVLNTVVNSYVASHLKQPGLILVANSTHVSKPLGIVIALPSSQMPVVPVADPCWESFENLMELCASCNDSNLDNGSELSILMLAADSANEHEDLDSGESGRLVMETLATLERTVINRATALGYGNITTVNTNPVTQAICAELGYRQKNAVSLAEFSSGNYASRVMIPKEYHDVTCYFMIKQLIE
ncbi:hypothetical protein Ciccas_005369 [Cichlidogyrus casuarinus]|uniref:Carrier domain-containing protein n=1 Tax=Cichlidogyrus casuarinus TaxID=1844966 RepID=A0ABD2Q9S2_9PLAT